MNLSTPPKFSAIADQSVRSAFVSGCPEVVRWLPPATRLFKWTTSLITPRGITPWWQFVESVRLSTGATVPGIQELRTRAARLGGRDRDFARARLAVSEEWNRMTDLIGVSLTNGAWGYIGKAAGQRKNLDDSKVLLIGGEYQAWIPGLTAKDVIRITLREFSPGGNR